MIDKRLQEDGYLLLKGVLDPSVLRSIKLEVVFMFNEQFRRLNIDSGSFEENLIQLFKTDLETYKNTAKSCQNLLSIYKLMASDQIVSYLSVKCGINESEAVVNTIPILYLHNKNLAVEEQNYKTPEHIDFATTQGSVPSYVVWLPLCNVFNDLGPLEIVKYSHKWNHEFSGFSGAYGQSTLIKNQEFMSVPMELGDLLIFDTLLIHRSGDNITETGIRWSLSFRYSNHECKDWIKRGYVYPYKNVPTTTKPYLPRVSE